MTKLLSIDKELIKRHISLMDPSPELWRLKHIIYFYKLNHKLPPLQVFYSTLSSRIKVVSNVRY